MRRLAFLIRWTRRTWFLGVMMDGRTSRATLAEELRAHAGPGTRVRRDLDGLIDALAAAGLFVGGDFEGDRFSGRTPPAFG